MSTTLDAHQIEAALHYLVETWPDDPMLPSAREEWADALAYVRVGELAPVIDRWETATRPSAGAVLDYILTNRERAPVVPKERPEPELGGRYTPVVVEAIQQARDALARRMERDLVSSFPDHRE